MNGPHLRQHELKLLQLLACGEKEMGLIRF
jgi:hypothetical protein